MGRSPGKWIKTLLFRKKSSRSHSSKGRDASISANDKEYAGGKGPSTLTVNSSVISQPVLISTNRSVPELEKGRPSNLVVNGVVLSPISQDAENQGITGPDDSNDPEKFREVHAAIKAQAAFRGYLARKEFHALKGIIRLQALIRGHLVRRQAVVTLVSLQGIVKFQALFRGRKVRLSGIALEVNAKYCDGKALDAKHLDNLKEKLSTNAFVCKLLSASPISIPLQIQYGKGEPNSVLSWLERWTSYHFWKPLRKKSVILKSQTKRVNCATEIEPRRPKRSVRRNSVATIDSGPSTVVSEPAKPKRRVRKVSLSPADSVQEHLQTELEKVKRNSRKVSNSLIEASDRPEVEKEKPIHNLRKVSRSLSEIQDRGIEDSAEKGQKNIVPTPDDKSEIVSTSISVAADGALDVLLDDHPAVELHPFQSIGKEDNLPVINGELNSKKEKACHENQKTSKWRASLSAKSENYADNGTESSPTLPSYMAPTESAKAKVRGESSPRFSSDAVDKNGLTRRHSLPSSTNGKLSSQSPDTLKLVLASGKGAVRNDRSLSSSRDGNVKAIQVEWRR